MDNSVYSHREMHNDNMTMTLSSVAIVMMMLFPRAIIHFVACKKCIVSYREQFDYSLMTVLNVM